MTRFAKYRRRDLYDMGELMRLTKLRTNTIIEALRVKGMPAPIFGEIPGTPLWLRSDIDTWNEWRLCNLEAARLLVG